uniref:Uncharacterized protein n=1 Tax=Setaria italica TaxID=4555 RepID=K4APF4_SETIT
MLPAHPLPLEVWPIRCRRRAQLRTGGAEVAAAAHRLPQLLQAKVPYRCSMKCSMDLAARCSQLCLWRMKEP